MGTKIPYNAPEGSGKMQNRIVFFSKAITIPVHRHGCYELVYYLQGDGAIDISGASYPFSMNTFSFSKPDSWQIEAHSNPGEVLFFGFETEEPFEMEEGVYSDDSHLTMLKIVSDIFLEGAEQKAEYEKMLSAKIQELIIALKRSRNEKPDASYSLDYSINYIKENYPSKIEFQNLSATCGYSYDYFRHQFQKRTGKSPQQYLIQTRLEAACSLLKHQTWSCTEIAYRCGFSNSAQFSSMFKSCFGLTPREYRKISQKTP